MISDPPQSRQKRNVAYILDRVFAVLLIVAIIGLSFQWHQAITNASAVTAPVTITMRVGDTYSPAGYRMYPLLVSSGGIDNYIGVAVFTVTDSGTAGLTVYQLFVSIGQTFKVGSYAFKLTSYDWENGVATLVQVT